MRQKRERLEKSLKKEYKYVKFLHDTFCVHSERVDREQNRKIVKLSVFGEMEVVKNMKSLSLNIFIFSREVKK